MARENSRWGYSRIRGELEDIGHRVARTTIANVLKANGIKSAPVRPSSWKTFFKAHWGQLAATDFFAAEVWTPFGLKTYKILFVIDLKTRRVEIAGITRHPTDPFMAQLARNLADVVDGFLKDHRFLICFGEASLRHAISEYVVHYHKERAHQGIGNERIEQRTCRRQCLSSPGSATQADRWRP